MNMIIRYERYTNQVSYLFNLMIQGDPLDLNRDGQGLFIHRRIYYPVGLLSVCSRQVETKYLQIES